MTNEFKEYPTILTAKDIEEILQLSNQGAYNLMDLPNFPLIKIGSTKRVGKTDFFKWLKTYKRETVHS